MKPESVRIVYFSPTGTTQSILEAIAKGTGIFNVTTMDITTPVGRDTRLTTSENELLILGVPVYMGRVPALIIDWLHSMDIQNTPTVSVVVYGNRTYEDALIELTDIVKKCGGIPIAGGAYIGEHSFSTPDVPTAAGRPDTDDLRHAGIFGESIRKKTDSAGSLKELSCADIPGEHPYRGDSTLWQVDFISVTESCISCGVCTGICPTGAINPDNNACIDTKKCITCCACIKKCPEHARHIKPGLVMDASHRLNTLYHEPKSPEYYL